MRGFTYRYMKKEGVVLLVCLWEWEFYSILFKHLKERGVCMKQGMKSILVVAYVAPSLAALPLITYLPHRL